jgi:hypothetical protein
MPWRGPEFDGEFPSLGWDILDWALEYLVVPDGPFAGQPLELTDEQAKVLVRFYQLDDRGRFVYRRGALRRAQGWGKSPLLAMIALAELAGPSRFDGWDASGEPVAVRPTTPWVQVAAVSEDQTDNTYAAAYAMAQESELAGTLIDIGITRMFLVGEIGRLEPVTAAAGSRLGQRVTFAVLDEPHLWTRRNGGHKLAATIRRNAAKMNGRTFESTNAHAVGEDSVAERTYHAHAAGEPGLLYDPATEVSPVVDLTDTSAVRAALAHAYGDSRWVDLDRLTAEIADPGTDPADARRFYLNQLTSGGECPFDMLEWDRLARPGLQVPDDAYVGLGFDGSISDDRTVLYGCWVRDDAPPHLFTVGRWAPDLGDRIDRVSVRDTISRTFDRRRVGRMFADPPRWWTEIDEWAEAHGEEVVLALDTNSARRFAPECDRFATAIREGSFTHDGDPELRQSLAACARKQVRLADDEDDGRSKFVIVKADTRKIDDAVGAILAYGAAMSMPALKPSTYLGPLVAFR